MTKVHVVAGSSKHTNAHVNKKGQPSRNITSSEYKEVLHNTLLPEGNRLFRGHRVSTWYLQQDNDPTHACAEQVVQAWNATTGSAVKLLKNWPPNSPDLNIIENVWAWAQFQVNKKGCKDFDEFRQAVIAILHAVPQGMIRKLFGSLKKRMLLVIKNQGKSIDY